MLHVYSHENFMLELRISKLHILKVHRKMISLLTHQPLLVHPFSFTYGGNA